MGESGSELNPLGPPSRKYGSRSGVCSLFVLFVSAASGKMATIRGNFLEIHYR